MKITPYRLKVFIDTNVLVDFLLLDREKHAIARELFQLVYTHQVEGVVSSQSILDASYICKKKHHVIQPVFREAIMELRDKAIVDSINSFDIQDAMRDPNEDLEDNAHIAFAYNQGCDVLLTNDQRFLSREVPAPMKVMPPEDFVNLFRA